MKIVDIFETWLRYEASSEDKNRIKKVLTSIEHPPIDEKELISRLLYRTQQMYSSSEEGNNRLEIIKYVKDVTGWGLKDCKDWCDANVFVVHSFQNAQICKEK